MKVAYLGPDGSFTSQAARAIFQEAELIPFYSIPQSIQAVEQGDVKVACVPIENTIEGTVNQTLDYLYHESKLRVSAELVLPINQQLIVHSNWVDSWQEAGCVYSHPHALAQSQRFLAASLPQARQETTLSTSAAAKYLSEHPDDNLAAIGPITAAKKYGLSVVQSNIEDIPGNETRFWLVGSNDIFEKTKFKRQTFAVSFNENKPGNLHQVLSVFSWRKIDLTKIESRPLKTKLGEYFFIIESCESDERKIALAIEELEILGINVDYFGSYPVVYLDALQ